MYAKTKGPVIEKLFRTEGGKQVMYAVNVYNIVDMNNLAQSRRDAAIAMQEPVYGATPTKPLATPPKAKDPQAHQIPSIPSYT